MNTDECATITPSIKPWLAYGKAALFLLPPVGFFAAASVFVLPKVQQMCADAAYDAQYLFGPVAIVFENWWLILIGSALLFAVLEMTLPLWRRHRSGALTGVVFLVNSAMLLGLFTSLIVTAIVGPALSRH